MVPSIKILSDVEILEIDRASRELLRTVGVKVDHEESLEILERAGANVDHKMQIVKIPHHLVEDALNKCQPSVRLYGRDGTQDVDIGGPNTYFATCGSPTFILDMESGTYREVLNKDLIDMIKLADVLTPPDVITGIAAPVDIPSELLSLHEFKLELMHTRKPLQIVVENKDVLTKILAMTEAVGINVQALIEKPFFSVLVCLTSPLVFRNDAAEMIVELARIGIPIFIDSGPMAGATSPATLAATLVTGNAEHLASFVLAKAVNPSVPVVYYSFARIFDMKSAAVSQGGPEYGMLRIGTSQMARFYRMPSAGGGILCDSKLVDVQTGIEKSGTALLASLGGTHLIMAMGLIASLNAISPEALMVDHEVVNYVKRVLRGIQVDEETIGLSTFEQAGIGGEFITNEHTLKHFRNEMWIPNLFNRNSVNLSTDYEEVSLKARAKEAVLSALEKHVPPELPKDIESTLDEIIHS